MRRMSITTILMPHEEVDNEKDEILEDACSFIIIFTSLISLMSRTRREYFEQHGLSWDPSHELDILTRNWALLSVMLVVTTVLSWRPEGFKASTCLILQVTWCFLFLKSNLPVLKDIAQTKGPEAASLAHLIMANCHGQFLLLLVTCHLQSARDPEDSHRKFAFLATATAWLMFTLAAQGFLPRFFPDVPNAYGGLIVGGVRVGMVILAMTSFDVLWSNLQWSSLPDLDLLPGLFTLTVMVTLMFCATEVYSPYVGSPYLF